MIEDETEPHQTAPLFDRKHRREIAIVAPVCSAGYVGFCLATGCPITLWQPLVFFGILGAVVSIPLTYLLPMPESHKHHDEQ